MRGRELEGWIERACAGIDRARLRDLVVTMVDIPSPTGEEAPLAERLAAELDRAGCATAVQRLDDRQANAVGRLAGDGTGEDLLLYAPIDTLTVGRAEEDVPWIGPALRPDMLPAAAADDDIVTGLGAGNPKGHGACVLAAIEAIAGADLPLRGDIIAGFGAGGMPTHRSVQGRHNTGQGVGCAFMLEQGVWPDHAVIAKPGWSVSWEEVGLAWFDIWVSGTHTYVGSRHRLPYRNAIVDAGRLAARLDDWFVEYAERHTDGIVAPQGIVAAVEGGWTRMAAVTPATCRLRVDLRLSPRTSPADAKRELADAVASIAAELGIDAAVEPVLAIPGESTSPDSWITRCAVAAWEAIAGSSHEPQTGMSGATDANILRARGIDTVRVGMPKAADRDFQLGMNTVDIAAMAQLTELLVRVAVTTSTRRRERCA